MGRHSPGSAACSRSMEAFVDRIKQYGAKEQVELRVRVLVPGSWFNNLSGVSRHLGDLAGTGDCSQRQLRGLGTAVPAAGWDCRGLGTAVILSYLRLNGTGTAVEKQNEGLQSPVLDCVWLGWP